MAYDKRLYEQAENEISARRMRAENELSERISETEKKIPEIAEIRRQLSNTSIELTKLILKKEGNFQRNFERIKEQNLQGQEMIKNLLLANGYPANHLEPTYHCKLCGDTGYKDGGRCECFEKLLNRLAVDRLNAEANMPYCDFEHFSLSYYDGKVGINGISCRKRMEENYNYCIQYAETFSKNSPNIFLLGKTGLGKTHLSLAIAKRVAERGYTAAYGSLLNYLRKIENENFGRSENAETDTMQTLINADLLVLDDLGSEFMTKFSESAVYNLINSRINLGVPTIISSNLSVDELQKSYNDRIISRIFGVFNTLLFDGDDIRQMKRMKM